MARLRIMLAVAAVAGALLPVQGLGQDARFPFESTHALRSPYGGSVDRPAHTPPFSAPLPAGLDAVAGPYRTFCVRLCDGYYFPISHRTDAIGLTADAERCAAACGGEARLFFHPNPGGDIAGMVDFTGRTYSSYPNAFKYRRTLVAGCQCRPQPWTEAELARHRSYENAGPPAEPPDSPDRLAKAESPPVDLMDRTEAEDFLAQVVGGYVPPRDPRGLSRADPPSEAVLQWEPWPGAGPLPKSVYQR